MGGGKERETEKMEKRVEEALNQETDRSRHKDEKQSSWAPRVWGLCVGIMSGAKHIQPYSFQLSKPPSLCTKLYASSSVC